MINSTYTNYDGNIVDKHITPDIWRTPQMPYEFSTLNEADMLQEKNRVKKELEHQLYGSIVKLGQDPATYDTDSHTVPEDVTTPNYPLYLEIAQTLSRLQFIANL